MSLATRCPACGTVFRVVQDQLKVSEGWVRCGRCSEVFNALEGLFDLARDSGPVPLDPPQGGVPAGAAAAAGASVAPPAPGAPLAAETEPYDAEVPMAGDTGADASGAEPPAPAAPGPLSDDPWTLPPDETGRREPAFDARAPWAADGTDEASMARDPGGIAPLPVGDVTPLTDADAQAAVAGRTERAAPAPAAGPSAPLAEPEVEASLSRPAFEDAQFPADALNEDPPVALSPAGRRARGRAGPAAAPVPGFVQRADRAARWQRPGVRVLLSLLVLVLTVGLAGQIAWHWRDRFAAQQPELRPWLAQACEALGCTLQPPRRPEALRVESSTLNKAGADVYRLTVVLRNTADHVVRSPHLDLTLTDNDGAVVARRAIGPELVSGAAAALESQAEATWQLTLSSGGRRVSGYTVAAFYP
jgi:predicted Zn finger-like uncharacterized protein